MNVLTLAFGLFHSEEKTNMEGMEIVNITSVSVLGRTEQQNGGCSFIYFFQGDVRSQLEVESDQLSNQWVE